MKSGKEETNGKEASGAEETRSSASNTGAVEELTGRGAMESANNAGDWSKVTQKVQGNLVYQGPDEDTAPLKLSDREFSDEKFSIYENAVSDKRAEKGLHQTCDDNGPPDEKAEKLANSDNLGTKEEGVTFNDQPAMNPGVVGDITLEGLLTLGLSKDICSQLPDSFHCYTMAEIRHVLSLPGPHKVEIAGIESLKLASEVYEMINFKRETSERWKFPDSNNLEKLSKINDLLGGLRADLKSLRKSLRRKWWRTRGNTAITSSVLKASSNIRKKADSLASKIQQNIAVKLCKLIVKDHPNFLYDNVEELAEMAKAEQKKPVWFLKGGSSRRKIKNVRRVKQPSDEN